MGVILGGEGWVGGRGGVGVTMGGEGLGVGVIVGGEGGEEGRGRV